MRVCDKLEGGLQLWGHLSQYHLAHTLNLELGILTNTSVNRSSLFFGFPDFKCTPLGSFLRAREDQSELGGRKRVESLVKPKQKWIAAQVPMSGVECRAS